MHMDINLINYFMLLNYVIICLDINKFFFFFVIFYFNFSDNFLIFNKLETIINDFFFIYSSLINYKNNSNLLIQIKDKKKSINFKYIHTHT